MITSNIVKKLLNHNNRRGIALVYVALLLIALLAFVALAIDIGYKYVAWTQLQNASDAASLAGVSKLPKFPATTNKNAFNNLSAARNESWRFAAKNQAAKHSVFLVQSSSHNSPPNDLNSSNDANGDIVVGHWSKSTGFTPANGTNAINAVKVVSRRINTGQVSNVSIGNNPLETFFGKIFKVNQMSAASKAVAAAPPGATNYILMCSTFGTSTEKGLECTPSCTYPNICPLSPPRILDKGDSDPYKAAFAWTSLSKQNTPNSYLNGMLCGRIFPNEDVCGVPIYTTGGQTSSVKALESAMYDPHFDTSTKEFSSGNVSAWWVIIPLANTCPPADQPTPYQVDRFALIRIIQACGSGMGNACPGNNYTAPSCPYGQNNKIAIDRFSCMSCAQRNLFIGLKWRLVKEEPQ